jgi:tRNA (guanine-N7-)-methyltransferase
MRMRTDKYAKEKCLAYPDKVLYFEKEESKKLTASKPIVLEIGSGKGGFITELAKEDQSFHYFGFEKFETIIVKALKKSIKENLSHLTLVRADASNLLSFFDKGSVSKLYLNFSDPWPKARHEKRRLTYKTFLNQYHHVLKDEGTLHLKTDNASFFAYSMVTLQAHGFEIIDFTNDLHRTNWPNIKTEFEQKYEATKAIHACVARKRV